MRSAFVDNAGIIDFDGGNEVSFKVETHNHPSAIEPFGGANTGTGGVIRDILGVSAKPIASTDVLCFGPADANPDKLPEGVLHPRRIRSGVVAGIEDYGNKIGIPTVSGAIWYDPAYTANPLVYCGCVGIAPKGKHVRSPKPGDHILLLGGKTGRDGLRGATFSSMTMDAKTGEVSGASVQIGDPITEKGLIEVLVRARNKGLYHAITDCGAGGLSSAVGEMGSRIGFDVELREVPLKYAGLAPWEIWLSEAQERMVVAVPSDKIAELQKICKVFDVALTDIGRFTSEKQRGRALQRRHRPRSGEHVPARGPAGPADEGRPARRARKPSPQARPAAPRWTTTRCCSSFSRTPTSPPKPGRSTSTITRSRPAPPSSRSPASRTTAPPTRSCSSRPAPRARARSCSRPGSTPRSASATRTAWPSA